MPSIGAREDENERKKKKRRGTRKEKDEEEESVGKRMGSFRSTNVARCLSLGEHLRRHS